MITKGMLLRAQTKTREDVFGDVTWEVAEIGLTHKHGTDGVKLVMLGGSGPAARKGYTVLDTESNIGKKISSGIVTVVPEEKRASVASFYADRSETKKRPSTGCVEL